MRAGVHRRDDLVPEEDLDIDRVFVDFAARDTLLAAMDEVEALYLLTPQAPQAVQQVRAAVAAARTCGVRRIVRHSLCLADTGRDALIALASRGRGHRRRLGPGLHHPAAELVHAELRHDLRALDP